jgi:hypothetical protein
MKKSELKNCPEWLVKADTFNEDVDWDIYGNLIWKGGEFRGGYFLGGEFRGGEFRGGEFLGGEFRGGYFLGGEFLGGEFLGGYFLGGEFRGGYFLGGEFRGGEFRGGYFLGGEFLGGEFLGGEFRGGYFLGGEFLGGVMNPHCKWRVCGVMPDGRVKIGCKEKTMEEWDAWFAGTEEFETKRGTKDFAKIHAMFLSLKAYVIFLKDFDKE